MASSTPNVDPDGYWPHPEGKDEGMTPEELIDVLKTESVPPSLSGCRRL